jgi:mannitol/fructose-specific phosphotransferase system IIA component (Ntr-type)
MFKPGCVKVPMEAADKHAAIAELVRLLEHEGLIGDREAVIRAIETRESVRSTGIGRGLAIPHGKTAAVERLAMAVGKVNPPIDFDSIDGRPVGVVVLMVSPQDQTGPHIRAMAAVSKLMMRPDTHRQISECGTPEDLYRLFSEGMIETTQPET